MTPGQRLAAARARKASRKAAKRGRQAEVLEGRVNKGAEQAGQWAAAHRGALWGTIAAVVALVGGATAYGVQQGNIDAEASALLGEAMATASAPIRVQGDTGSAAEADEETYRSERARSEAALDSYRRVIELHADREAAVWARLGEGATLLDLGRHEEAREAFEQALGDAGDRPAVARRALEGVAMAYEAEEQWDQALERYRELRDVQDFRLLADFHMARMYQVKGDETRAKELLQSVLGALREPRDDGLPTPELAYVERQAELRLAEMDSSLVPQSPGRPGAGGGPGLGMPPGLGTGPGGGGGLTQEQLEQLIQKMKQQGGAAP